MVVCYVDPATGNDSTGTGTWAAPYLSVQGALDDPAGWSIAANTTTGGNEIRIVAGTADILASPISFVTWAATVTQAKDNRLTIRGNGASAEGDYGVGEINGNAAVAIIFNVTGIITYVNLVDIKIGNVTGNAAQLHSVWSVIACHIHTWGTNARGLYVTGDGCTIRNNYFELPGYNASNGAGILSVGNSIVIADNFFKGGILEAVSLLSGNGAYICGNVIAGNFKNGINCSSNYSHIVNNTITGSTIASAIGINIPSGAEVLSVYGNIVTNISPGQGINNLGDTVIQGNNHYYNNSTANSKGNVSGLDITSDDQTTDPTFADAAGDDYSVGTNAKAKGWPSTIYGSSTSTYIDTGAAQRQEAGGLPGMKRIVGMAGSM